MTESAITVYKEYIANLQDQLTAMNTKLDALQESMLQCKDSVASLNTTIAESTNYLSVLLSPYGAAVICVIAIALCIIAVKKGFSISKGDATISVGKKDEKNN